MLELARRHPRSGYRLVTKLLRREGWQVNRKRIYRLWRQEGLQVRRRVRKRRRLGQSANGIVRRRPQFVGDVWGLDFIHDETTDGRRLRWLSVLDEYSRYNLALEVERHFLAVDVIRVLERLIAHWGPPQHMRFDNGPEFIAKALRGWLERNGIGALYIAPGSPWENGYTESFHGTVRAELLEVEAFTSPLEAKVLTKDFRQRYNHERPHTALDDRTPAEFVASQENSLHRRPQSAPNEVARGIGTPEITVRLS